MLCVWACIYHTSRLGFWHFRGETCFLGKRRFSGFFTRFFLGTNLNFGSQEWQHFARSSLLLVCYGKHEVKWEKKITMNCQEQSVVYGWINRCSTECNQNLTGLLLPSFNYLQVFTCRTSQWCMISSDVLNCKPKKKKGHFLDCSEKNVLQDMRNTENAVLFCQ